MKSFVVLTLTLLLVKINAEALTPCSAAKCENMAFGYCCGTYTVESSYYDYMVSKYG